MGLICLPGFLLSHSDFFSFQLWTFLIFYPSQISNLTKLFLTLAIQDTYFTRLPDVEVTAALENLVLINVFHGHFQRCPRVPINQALDEQDTYILCCPFHEDADFGYNGLFLFFFICYGHSHMQNLWDHSFSNSLSIVFVRFCLVLFLVSGMKLTTSHLGDRHCATELHPWSSFNFNSEFLFLRILANVQSHSCQIYIYITLFMNFMMFSWA